MSQIAQILSPDDNCFVRRAKRQTIIETWWRRGGLDDDQYRVLDALARDLEGRLRSQSGYYVSNNCVYAGASNPNINANRNVNDCDRLTRLTIAKRAIGSLKDPRAWPLLELVLCDVSPTPVTSVTQAARLVRCCPRYACSLLRDCADALNGLPVWRHAAQRTPIWALG